MTKLRYSIFFITLLVNFLLAPIVLADFEISKWLWVKEIRLPSFSEKNRVVTITVDNEIFENAKDGLADLRIIDDSSRETPYKLTIESFGQSREAFNVKILNLGSITGEHTQLVLDLQSEGVIHNSVTIHTSSRDFRRQVEVEASQDGESWFVIKKASEGGYIYDYSLDFKAQNTTVNYPDSTYRFLRLKIIDRGEEPIKITGATVYHNVLTAARRVSYDPKVVGRGEDKERRSNFFVIDLGAKGIPNNKLEIATSDVNFNREVLIEGSNDQNTWQTLTTDVIFSYQTPKFNGEKKTVDYLESNWRFLRLTVFNRDNAPISIGDFKVSGTLRKVLFQAELGRSYKLYYGNLKSRFPEYDLESYFQYLDKSNPLVAVLGVQEKNSSFKGEVPPKKPLTERYPFLLPGVLGVLVLILGSMVVKLAFQVKKGR